MLLLIPAPWAQIGIACHRASITPSIHQSNDIEENKPRHIYSVINDMITQ